MYIACDRGCTKNAHVHVDVHLHVHASMQCTVHALSTIPDKNVDALTCRALAKYTCRTAIWA